MKHKDMLQIQKRLTKQEEQELAQSQQQSLMPRKLNTVDKPVKLKTEIEPGAEDLEEVVEELFEPILKSMGVLDAQLRAMEKRVERLEFDSKPEWESQEKDQLDQREAANQLKFQELLRKASGPIGLGVRFARNRDSFANGLCNFDSLNDGLELREKRGYGEVIARQKAKLRRSRRGLVL